MTEEDASRCGLSGRLWSPSVLRAVLKRHNVAPRRSLGQNFLIDANILRKIIEAVRPSSGDLALEVGAGAGTLTHALASSGCNVVAVEIDPGLLGVLRETVGNLRNVWILRGDVLALDLSEVMEAAKRRFYGEARVEDPDAPRPERGYKIVSNIPYYITSPFLYEIFKGPDIWGSMTLMVQEEVARRMMARPKDEQYGTLSVIMQSAWDIHFVTKVARTSFWPVPDVDSAILHFTPRRGFPREEDKTVFLEAVKAAFRSRRKTILNSFTLSYGVKLGMSKEEIAAHLQRSGLDPGRRAQELDLDDFVALAGMVQTWRKSHKRVTL
ncbi:MAG TPA: ribosomal RNA small subunit methyltransferase A [Clostridia bacterium]|nr:ribosomal RNA small subunit methyltransferase A [Clostridia bacterium]